MQPVDVDTSTGRSILGHKVLDAHPVLDMVEVLVDPDGTLRSHEWLAWGVLALMSQQAFLPTASRQVGLSAMLLRRLLIGILSRQSSRIQSSLRT